MVTTVTTVTLGTMRRATLIIMMLATSGTQNPSWREVTSNAAQCA